MDPETILANARRAQAAQIAEAKARRLAAEEARLQAIQLDPEKADLLKAAEATVAKATEEFEIAAARIDTPVP